MSAPDTDTEKQEKAHRGPLRLGIMLPILFAVTLLAVLIVAVFLGGEEPEGAEEQVDTATGEVEPASVVPSDD